MSLPKIEGGMDGTIEFKMQVNPSAVPDGATTQILIAPTTNRSVPSLSTTTMVSNGMILLQVSTLRPDTEYNYTITFVDVGAGRLGHTLQGTFRTNSTLRPILPLSRTNMHKAQKAKSCTFKP